MQPLEVYFSSFISRFNPPGSDILILSSLQSSSEMQKGSQVQMRFSISRFELNSFSVTSLREVKLTSQPSCYSKVESIIVNSRLILSSEDKVRNCLCKPLFIQQEESIVSIYSRVGWRYISGSEKPALCVLLPRNLQQKRNL